MRVGKSVVECSLQDMTIKLSSSLQLWIPAQDQSTRSINIVEGSTNYTQKAIKMEL